MIAYEGAAGEPAALSYCGRQRGCGPKRLCFEDFDNVQSAMRHGAIDYLTKLLLSETEFVACLGRAVEGIRAARLKKHLTLRQLLQDRLLSPGAPPASAEELEGESAGFRQFRLALLRLPGDARQDAAQLAGAYEREDAPYASIAIRLAEPLWAVLFASTEPNGCADFNAWTMHALTRGYDVAPLTGSSRSKRCRASSSGWIGCRTEGALCGNQACGC